MATWIRLAKLPGEKAERYVPTLPFDGERFTTGDIAVILCGDFTVLRLPSGDYLAVRYDFEIASLNSSNSLASILTNRIVNHDAVLLNATEFSYEDWLRSVSV